MRKLLAQEHIRLWIAVMGTATLIIGAAYSMVQQSTRLAADDLPLATAQTIKNELNKGATPADVVSNQIINLKTDSNVFVIVADSSRHVLASSASLEGQTPLPPQGTFSYTAAHGSDHFTWQPASKVRLATRMLTYGQDPNSGFIITGQSLSQAEARINIYTAMAVATWFAVLAWTYMFLILPAKKPAKK